MLVPHPFRAALVLSAVCLAVAANGAELRDRVQDLATQSDMVVLATCQDAESAWDEEQRIIVTRSRLQPRQTFKGLAAGEPITVLTLGGQVGDVSMAASHGATLNTGESAVLFLKRSQYGPYYVIWGGEDGKLPVEESAEGQALIGVHPAVGVDTFAAWVREGGTAE